MCRNVCIFGGSRAVAARKKYPGFILLTLCCLFPQGTNNNMSEIELQSVRSIDEKPPVYDNEAYINNDSNNASLRYRPDNSFDSRDTQVR